MRAELDAVDGTLVVSCVVEEGPFSRSDFAVDADGSVEGAGGEDDSEFWVGPCDGPDGAGVSFEGGGGVVGVAVYVVDLDCAICVHTLIDCKII